MGYPPVGKGRGTPGGTRGRDGVTPHVGANGHWFIGNTDTGVSATGTSVDASEFKEGSVPKWDTKEQKLVDSGIVSDNDGELKISPSSIFFGNHAMEASLENVVFRNLHTHKIYAPMWQEVAPGQNVGYVRSYSSTIDKVVRVPDGSIDVTNPVNENVQVGVNEVFLGGKFTLSQDATNLMIEIYDHVDHSLIWRQRLGDQTAGEKNVTFEVPFDVRAGYAYDVKLLSSDGSDVVAKSNSRTGFSWTINRALWKDVPIATQDWVNDLSLAKTFAIENGKLKIAFVDGSTQDLDLPSSTSGSVVIPPLTSEMVSKAIDNGVAVDGASIKSLSDGWWVIPESATGITGRPKGAQGDLTYFRQYTDNSHAVGIIFGRDRNDEASMWVQYKQGTKWTRWLPVTSSAELSGVTSDIASLKLGNAAAISRIERLETQVGKIYAPSKLLFDQEVDGLIDSKLAAYVPPKDPKIAQIQQELDDLKSKLPGTVTPSGGDKQPVVKPEITVMFTNSIPSSVTENSPVTSTTGEARITRVSGTPSRLWVLVENDNDEADKVKGISVNKGMEAVWQSRDVVIGGKKYRAFYSAGAYTETEVSVKVNFEVL